MAELVLYPGDDGGGPTGASAIEGACGDCLHWHAMPSDPKAIGERRGECRRNPPGIIGVPARTPLGMEMNLMAAYPLLPPAFPACSMMEQAKQDHRKE